MDTLLNELVTDCSSIAIVGPVGLVGLRGATWREDGAGECRKLAAVRALFAGSGAAPASAVSCWDRPPPGPEPRSGAGSVTSWTSSSVHRASLAQGQGGARGTACRRGDELPASLRPKTAPTGPSGGRVPRPGRRLETTQQPPPASCGESGFSTCHGASTTDQATTSLNRSCGAILKVRVDHNQPVPT